MGVKLKPILVYSEISLESLNGKVVAFDAFNVLYQFLSSVRQYDGTYLMDSKGRITSHISGIFYRMAKLISYGIRPVFVFDGERPKFKQAEIESRRERKDDAIKKYEEALDSGDVSAAAFYARQITHLTRGMIEDAKHLLELMGIPVVMAKSEAEAQAAEMCKRGVVDAVASQDFDALVFGSPSLLRNVSFSEKRKMPGKKAYHESPPEYYSLKRNLDHLGITRRQLILISMLVGNDFFPGIKGLGPKKSLSVVRSSSEGDVISKYGLPEDVIEFFENPPYRPCELEFSKPDYDKLREYLIDHDFSHQRVDKAIAEMKKERDSPLSRWMQS